jgi:DNA ligase (NAD+)
MSTKIQTEVNLLLENTYDYAHKISVAKLESMIRYISNCYYNSGTSLVPDSIFDILRDILKERDSHNIFFSEIGAPISKDMVKLPYPMASLDKIKPTSDALRKWKKIYGGPYFVSDKLDGVSALLTYENGILKLYSRGDGLHGQDISALISYVLPSNFKTNKFPNKLAVRGELIIKKKTFDKVKGTLKNGRNAVAGLVNSKTLTKRLHIAQATDFVAYSLIYPKFIHTEQMKILSSYKLNVVNNLVTQDVTNNFLSKYLIKRRTDSVYDVDGIVVLDSSKKYNIENKNPRHGFAFKQVLTDQIAETTVLKIIWDVSMDGYLKPTLKVSAVNIGGVTVKSVTAHNAKYVIEHVLGPGAIIKLVRSGDVIPYISKVLSPSALNKPQLPTTPYKWNKSNVDLMVKNMKGVQYDNIIIKQMAHFFKTLGIKYISEGIITKLVESGYTKITDIIKLDIDEASQIDGIGETLLNKILTNINNALNTTTLEVFMAASHKFGRGFGKRKIKSILLEYPEIMTVNWTKNKMKNNILDIHGFDEVTASQFTENFDTFKKFYKKINKVYNLKHIETYNKKNIKNKKLFKDLSIVLTGFRDKTLEQFIENNGGSVKSTVSSNTDLVVFVSGIIQSSKLKKAIKLKIKQISKDDFINMYINTD